MGAGIDSHTSLYSAPLKAQDGVDVAQQPCRSVQRSDIGIIRAVGLSKHALAPVTDVMPPIQASRKVKCRPLLQLSVFVRHIPGMLLSFRRYTGGQLAAAS